MDTAWRPNGFLIKKLKMKKYYQHSYATFWLGLIVGVLVGAHIAITVSTMLEEACQIVAQTVAKIWTDICINASAKCGEVI